jgi:hypothetical protein
LQGQVHGGGPGPRVEGVGALERTALVQRHAVTAEVQSDVSLVGLLGRKPPSECLELYRYPHPLQAMPFAVDHSSANQRSGRQQVGDLAQHRAHGLSPSNSWGMAVG